MLSLLLDKILGGKSKLRDDIVRLSFFTFQGLLGSILLNDVIRILVGDFKEKETLEYGLASFISVAPFLSQKLVILSKSSNNFALTAGMFAGILLVNKSEVKK